MKKYGHVCHIFCLQQPLLLLTLVSGEIEIIVAQRW